MKNETNYEKCSIHSIVLYYGIALQKEISLSALSGSSSAWCSVMIPLSAGSAQVTLWRHTKHQKWPSTIWLIYPVLCTILAGTRVRTGQDKMAGYPANQNQNRISGTSLLRNIQSWQCFKVSVHKNRSACYSVQISDTNFVSPLQGPIRPVSMANTENKT